MESKIPEPFLRQLATYLHGLFPDDMSGLTLVLPNKRSGLFLRHYLSELQDRPVWAPQMFSVEEFTFELSGFSKADPSVLLFLLYQSYREVMDESAETFVSFLPWGQVLLDDFNELDAKLISASEVFTYLSEAKAIELWNPGASHLSDTQQSYLNFYRSLNLLYADYTQRLIKRGSLYPGLAARMAAESLQSKYATHGFGKIIFAGLNALTEAENVIVQYFRKNFGAECLWDADAYYMDDPNQEAGAFLRKHRELEGDAFRWLSNNIGSRPIRISMIGVPGRTGQVKKASAILHTWEAKGIPMDHRLAVVLSDEGLLLPMLNAIPESVSDINVTMGLPLRQTTGFSFLDTWLDIMVESTGQVSKEGTESRAHAMVYRVKILLNLLSHPWMMTLLPAHQAYPNNTQKSLIEKFVNQGIIYLNQEWVSRILSQEGFPVETIALMFPEKRILAKDIPKHGRQLLGLLHEGLMQSPGTASYQSEEEAIYAFHAVFEYLETLWLEFNVSDEISAFRKIFDKICKAKQLSFSGEPLKGLQLMGLLETRSLDFNRIILLSANEDILPSGKHQNSFLPHDIRQHFNLPNQHYMASVFAYHFYRLIQRAEEVVFLYDTEPGEIGGGEMSRFLAQLIMELPHKNPLAQIDRKTLALIPTHQKSPAISIVKDEGIINSLKQRADQGFSASSLITLQQCTLKYYFKYIARIVEPDDFSEELDSRDLGNIVHLALQKLYVQATGSNLTLYHFKLWQETLDRVMKESFQELFPEVNKKQGKTLLLFELASAYVKNFLTHESKWIQEGGTTTHSPAILGLEKAYRKVVQIPGLDHHVSFYGVVDRIDKISDRIRILDYKTGIIKDQDVEIKDWKELTGGKKEKAFQLLFYSYLVSGAHSGFLWPFDMAIISLRSLSNGPFYFKNSIDGMAYDDILNEFEQYLFELITQLLNPSISFQQIESEENCKYCPYQLICNRVVAPDHY